MSQYRDVRDVESLSPEEAFLEKLRHTAAHVMAQAVRRFWPATKLAIGPTVEDGFYYDMQVPEALGPEQLDDVAHSPCRAQPERVRVEVNAALQIWHVHVGEQCAHRVTSRPLTQRA